MNRAKKILEKNKTPNFVLRAYLNNPRGFEEISGRFFFCPCSCLTFFAIHGCVTTLKIRDIAPPGGHNQIEFLPRPSGRHASSHTSSSASSLSPRRRRLPMQQRLNTGSVSAVSADLSSRAGATERARLRKSSCCFLRYYTVSLCAYVLSRITRAQSSKPATCCLANASVQHL